MGSKLLNGSPQLSVRVTMPPSSVIVSVITTTLGTGLGAAV